MKAKVWCCVFALSLAISTSAAPAATLSWFYQSTGFQTSPNGDAQTALAMRDGRTWPVIFSESNSQNVQAYSLYPTLNTQLNPATYWHQTGTNLLYGGYGGTLSAATSSDGRVGAVLQVPKNPQYGQAVVGSTSGGFGAPMSGVSAIAFNSAGQLVQGTATTVPPVQGMPSASSSLFAVSAAPNGDLGAVDVLGTYYQYSSLTGWQGAVPGNFHPGSVIAADLAFDGLSRPHVVESLGTNAPVVAFDFDVMRGQWVPQTLCSNAISLATLAAGSKGDVGAVWVQPSANGAPELMYAHKDGIDDWTTQVVTTGVTDPLTGQYESVAPQEKLGLAFDANDYPVISFTAGPGNIFLAYDPIVTPEPGALMLLATASVAFAGYFWRKRRAR